MKITVINGTKKHGVTYKLKEIFLDEFRDRAEITEFYLPEDCPNFCAGCTVCFLDDEHKCKDAQFIQKIEKYIINSEDEDNQNKSNDEDGENNSINSEFNEKDELKGTNSSVDTGYYSGTTNSSKSTFAKNLSFLIKSILVPYPYS